MESNIIEDKHIVEAFNKWLHDKNIKGKYSKDVKSRVRRASKFVDLTANVSEDELLSKLANNVVFNELSMSVKSQLKRSVTLYKQFKEETGV